MQTIPEGQKSNSFDNLANTSPRLHLRFPKELNGQATLLLFGTLRTEAKSLALNETILFNFVALGSEALRNYALDEKTATQSFLISSSFFLTFPLFLSLLV